MRFSAFPKNAYSLPVSAIVVDGIPFLCPQNELYAGTETQGDTCGNTVMASRRRSPVR